MKIILTVLLLGCLLLMYWGCREAAVKTGPAQGEAAASASRTGTEPADEQEASNQEANREAESDRVEEGESIEAGETEKPVLNIDEEKEADSIYTVIETLEDCYRTRNFDRWLSLLTRAYKEHFDDPHILASEGWDARNIREFFHLLVSARRRGNIGDLEISRVEFVSDYKAFVYVILGDEEFPQPQHTFIRIGENWYKGLSTEEV